MINVLLASYRGERHIGTQIASILTQKSVKVKLWVSDDVSAVACRAYLSRIFTSEEMHSISVLEGKKSGVNANFLHLIHTVGDNDPNDLYAYSDQDDVWLPLKLNVASQALECIKANTPLPQLYAGRTQVVDEQLRPLFVAKGMSRSASFKNALIESVAGGNTMVFNQATQSLLNKVIHPAHHDWLTYMVVTACGGQVIFDDTPYVLYRQHGDNVIGANNNIISKLSRVKKLFNRQFRSWSNDNIAALQAILPHMTAENRILFEHFVRLHHMNSWYLCFNRLFLFCRLGLYRQRKLDHFGFMIAAFLGKI